MYQVLMELKSSKYLVIDKYVFDLVLDFGSGESEGASANETNITCSPTFYLENSTCLPECEEWLQISFSLHSLVTGTAYASSLLAVLGGVAVIVGSIIRYKSM